MSLFINKRLIFRRVRLVELEENDDSVTMTFWDGGSNGIKITWADPMSAKELDKLRELEETFKPFVVLAFKGVERSTFILAPSYYRALKVFLTNALPTWF